jgi:hypothetical protein
MITCREDGEAVISRVGAFVRSLRPRDRPNNGC